MLDIHNIRKPTVIELVTISNPRMIPKVLEPRLKGLVRRIARACSTRNDVMGRAVEARSIPLVIPVETGGVDEGRGGGIGEERH